MQQKKQEQMEIADHSHRLSLQKLQEEDAKARQRDSAKVEMQNRAAAQREALRRKTEMEIQEQRRRTDEHRAALERENMKARALAEAEGRIKEQRENEDVFARQIKLKGEQQVSAIKAGVTTFFAELGTTMSSFITDGDRVGRTVLAVSLAAAGIYSMREGARVGGRILEKRLLTPSLVRESSASTGRFSLRGQAKHWFDSMRGVQREGESLTDVILRKDIADRVQRLAVATRNTRANGAPYRHMMFYGPPGTGKTMLAKRLARSSGMDYAIMSGGDVGPLGKEAVTELHRLFDYAERSQRGMLLFIDEADAFLASRSKAAMSEEQRNALNALLFRTGEASDRFMMVLATNRPGDLDSAVLDRTDESLLFDLPDAEARKALVRQYFKKYITDAGSSGSGVGGLMGFKRSAKIILDSGFSDEWLDRVAERTEGFSGRGIAKLMLSVQGNVYGRGDAKLTQELADQVLEWKLAEFRSKGELSSSSMVDAYNTAGSAAATAEDR
ncbi:atad3 [Symbiodinium sp. KB8]|nr:atad3 [Symbiodinium sp. KB8]